MDQNTDPAIDAVEASRPPLLPQYKSHKVVHAALIIGTGAEPATEVAGLWLLLFIPDGEQTWLHVSQEWCDRVKVMLKLDADAPDWSVLHDQYVYVLYQEGDGYDSVSPRASFDSGYVRLGAVPPAGAVLPADDLEDLPPSLREVDKLARSLHQINGDLTPPIEYTPWELLLEPDKAKVRHVAHALLQRYDVKLRQG